MIVERSISGLLLLQEVGFDIVSLWGQTGYLAKGVAIAAGLIFLYLVGLLISKVAQRK